jgi:transposase
MKRKKPKELPENVNERVDIQQPQVYNVDDIYKRIDMGSPMELRELKALEIAARSKIGFRDGAWQVPSQTSISTKYKVTIGESPSCDCEDFQLTRKPCKHIIAASLVCARDHDGKAPEIVVDAVPKRPTYKQDWPKYDLAQMTEKKRFLALLFDLTRGIQDPPQPAGKPGRKPISMRDMVFASALKVFTTFSSRRFACDLADAYEKGYLSQLMHSVRVCAYLEYPLLTPVLEGLIVRSSLPLKSIETTLIPDSTGFSTSRFVRWHDEKYGTMRSGKAWVKAHAICGAITNIVTAVEIAGQYDGDCPMFKPLVETTAKNFNVQSVPADKAYLSHENLAQVDKLGATAWVPFKSNSIQGEAGSLWEKMYLFYNYRREEFLKKYHQRSNIESTFSMVKAKFRDHVRSKTDVAMKNEVLTKFLCHNIVVVHQSQIELGIEAEFWQKEQEGTRDVLPLIQV